ncbi:MAG: hypothetical protein J7M34_05025 [Anaerolineae bacterium]|nr:hypothetical protein [Anaerolineae bacterium]
MTLDTDGRRPVLHVQAQLTLETTDDKGQQQVKLRIAGSPNIAPKSITLTVNKHPVPLQADTSSALATQITLSPGQRVHLELGYDELLPEEPLISISYDLSTAWPTKDGSALARLRLPSNVPREAWVSVDPSPTQFDGQAVEWHFTQAAPDLQVRMEIVSPAVWNKITAPSATRGDLAGALAQIDTLLSLVAVDAPNGPAFTRFYPLALARIDRAMQTAADNPELHLRLARLYALHRQDDGAIPATYAALVAAEAEAAVRLGAPTNKVEPLLRQAYQDLLEANRAAGRWEEAIAYLDKLSKLPGNTPTLGEERQSLQLHLARARLKAGDWIGAERIAHRALGDSSQTVRIDPPPWLQSALARVETWPGRRVITVQMFPAPGRADDAVSQAHKALQSLRSLGVAQVTAAATGESVEFQITIPIQDAGYFIASSRALANALPSEPEWAFLSQLLRPKTFRWDQLNHRLYKSVVYAEDVNLHPANDVWDARASQVEQETQTAISGLSGPVNDLIREMGKVSAAAWRDLGQYVQARYIVHLHPTDGTPRQWLIFPDDTGVHHLSAAAVEFTFGPLRWLRIGGMKQSEGLPLAGKGS